MEKVLDKHKQDFNDIRRLCLLCHGLDLTSSNLFTYTTYKAPSENTKSVLHSLISSSLLNLAIAIRINLYQGEIKNKEISLQSMAADYYLDDELISKSVTIKDVCDKIIHADSITKTILPKELIERDVKISFQLKGTQHRKSWTLNLCLELFVETILMIMDEIEKNNA